MNDNIVDSWRDGMGEPGLPAFSDSDSSPAPDPPAEEFAVEAQRLREENTRLAEALRRVRRQNVQLRQRLVTQNATPSDTATLDDSLHNTMADRYNHLVQQDFQHFARQHLQGRGGRSDPRRVAGEIRVLCQELLTGGDSTTGACSRLGLDPVTHGALLDGLITKVRALTDQIRSDVWDFDGLSGAYLDPDVQQPWGQCESHHPVVFVVAPAYRTNGRVYARQLVFTAVKSRWRI